MGLVELCFFQFLLELRKRCGDGAEFESLSEGTDSCALIEFE